MIAWLRERHTGPDWGMLRRRHLPELHIRAGKAEMLRPRTIWTAIP
jgi:hypothetical protein